ncbi:hypothetical protein FKG94_13625 [Exilibacterium tricleocarpae]|uniref:Uncharacterized protein n=1 Tax=Exilibacterium tricleocarpae TaxID=2591008 RepID=A0A545TLP3_9GAMM|nr:hypothetical protein [Exilibacterium tricleocarpae]TQV78114.1 hypothetical protein FKG94_13625 [Exilibacterium tricleocarpae]
MLEKILNKKAEPDAPTGAADRMAAVSPDKVSLFFGSEESDEILLERLKIERNLYRVLDGSETPRHLAQQVLAAIQDWGFCDYSFMRFDTVNLGDDRLALMPVIVMASHPGNSGLRLLVTAGDIRARHLARIYYALTCLPAEMFGKLDGRYLLMASTSTDNYTVSTGQPDIDRALSLSTVDNDEGQQYLITALANKIEGIGKSKFATVFKHSEGTDINPRPRRLIKALAQQDVTLRDAAALLNVSHDTVNKHIAAAKQALGTKTIAATIWEAAKRGLIDDSSEEFISDK